MTAIAQGALCTLHATISPFDEAELCWFFGLDLPGVPGRGSSFGATLARAQVKKRQSMEQPTPGTPWTEILKCKPANTNNLRNTTEDAVLEYLDAHRRAARIRAVLRQLSAVEYTVLEARFGCARVDERLKDRFGEHAKVALLTTVALRENGRRARADRHEPVVETLADLVEGVKRKGPERERARTILDGVRAEAIWLTDGAVTRFIQVRDEVRS